MKTMTVEEYKAALTKNPRKVAGRVNNHTELVKAIVARLNLIAGVSAIPMNTGEIHQDGVHVKYGFSGMADVMVRRPHPARWKTDMGAMRAAAYLHPEHFPHSTLWLEAKTGTGRPSKAQIAFKEMVERWGDRYVICRSVDDAEEAIC